MIIEPPFLHARDPWPAARPIIDDTAEHPAVAWPPPQPRQLTWRSPNWTTHKAYRTGHYYEIVATVDPDRWTVMHARWHRYLDGQPLTTIGHGDTIEEAKAAAERHLQTELAITGAVDALVTADDVEVAS